MSVTQTAPHLGPLADQRLEQIAFDIFRFRFPEQVYYDDIFHAERAECRHIAQLMARRLGTPQEHSWSIPSGQGIDERWQRAYVVGQIGNVLSELAACVPFKSLDTDDRTWVREQVEQLVEDAMERFTTPPGDMEYTPQEEPEYWGI